MSKQELWLCSTEEHEFWNRIRIVAQPLICNVTLKNIVKIFLLQFLYFKNNEDHIFFGGGALW